MFLVCLYTVTELQFTVCCVAPRLSCEQSAWAEGFGYAPLTREHVEPVASGIYHFDDESSWHFLEGYTETETCPK